MTKLTTLIFIEKNGKMHINLTKMTLSKILISLNFKFDNVEIIA